MTYTQTWKKDCPPHRFFKDANSGEMLCVLCTKVKNTDSPGEKKENKYKAKRTEFGGVTYDSGFEAKVGATLEFRKKAKDIKDFERQYQVEIYAEGKFICKHKIDFRVHENDGSFTLIEAKGMATADWKWRRKMLELFWLPKHLDHSYEVVKQSNF